MNTSTVHANAKALQRKGLTLTEIADILDRQRHYIIRILYWDIVRDK